MIATRRLPKDDSPCHLPLLLVLFVLLAVSLAALPPSFAETEASESEPLPPTRLEIWIGDADGAATEKASIPLVEEGTFAVRFVLDEREIAGLEDRGEPVKLRWELVARGEVHPGSPSGDGSVYAVEVRPELYTEVAGCEQLALLKTAWKKPFEAAAGEVVEIEVPASRGKIVIPSEGLRWNELPDGVRQSQSEGGDGLLFDMATLMADFEASLVLRLRPES